MKKAYLTHLNYTLKTDWNDIRSSTFANLFDKTWREKENAGLFRYRLRDLEGKFLEGHYRFFAQLNADRATKRRKPDSFVNLNQPPDDKLFNFTKISIDEYMFEVIYKENETVNENTGNYLAINVSPLEFGHSLLVPSLFERLPQVITLDSLKFALYTLLSIHNPAFRVGFNSLCGYATVNHLHLHAYYLNHTMLLETIDVDYLSGNCYILENYPSQGFVFQITSLTDVHLILRDVYQCTKYLNENEIAHNIYMTRGLSFEKSKCLSIETTERNCIRIYVWARTHSKEVKILDEFNPALCELFGHILVKTEESYNSLTEAHVAEILDGITHAPFKAIKEKVALLFQAVEQ